MIKYSLLFLFLLQLVKSDADSCNSRSIDSTSDTGILPYGSRDLVKIPEGETCIYNFSIPYGSVLELTIDYYISENNSVAITNSLGEKTIYNDYDGVFESNYWCTAGLCQLQIENLSGKVSFIAYYGYHSLDVYTAINKLTGDFFQLSQIGPTQYLKFYGSQIALTLAQNVSWDAQSNLQNYYVYNGPDLLQNAMIGTLADLKDNSLYFGLSFICIVNFYIGADSDAFIIANDGSEISSKYTFIVAPHERLISQEFSDFTEEGSSVTFVCVECNQFFITQLMFDTLSMGYVAFQGQTPSQSFLSKVINYNASTFSQNQLPQIIPTNRFTSYFYKSNFTLQLYSGEQYDDWQRPYSGRKGLIISTTLWDNLLFEGNFDYEFRNGSQVFNFSISIDKMDLSGAKSDELKVMIGCEPGFYYLVNLTYPGTDYENVTSIGNFMDISSNFSFGSKIILSFEISQAEIPSTSTMEIPTATAKASSVTTQSSFTTTLMLSSTTTVETTTTTFTTQSSSPTTTTVPTTTNDANSELLFSIIFWLHIVIGFL